MKTEKTSGIGPYIREFIPAMSAYFIILMAVIKLRPAGDNLGLWELLPTIPLLFAFWAIIRQFRRMDEFFQRVHAEAFALGAVTWGLFIMVWGFAENAGAPALSTMFLTPGLIAFWGLSLPIIMRRYK